MKLIDLGTRAGYHSHILNFAAGRGRHGNEVGVLRYALGGHRGHSVSRGCGIKAYVLEGCRGEVQGRKCIGPSPPMGEASFGHFSRTTSTQKPPGNPRRWYKYKRMINGEGTICSQFPPGMGDSVTQLDISGGLFKGRGGKWAVLQFSHWYLRPAFQVRPRPSQNWHH